MDEALVGWETLAAVCGAGGAVRRKADLLLAFVHYNLTRRGFRCLGRGDERTLIENESASELLPEGWSEEDQYKLRYILEKKLYIVHGMVTDGIMIINLMRAEDLALSSISVNLDENVKELTGPIEKTMPNYKEIQYNLKRDLIDTMCAKATTSTETQTAGPVRSLNDSLHRPSGGLVSEYPLYPPTPPLMDPRADVFQIGRQDLEPFPMGGGGMIYNPFGPNRGPPVNPGIGIPGGLPRNAIPPGARFDPFGPPDFEPNRPRRQPPPDADHFPPPGFM